MCRFRISADSVSRRSCSASESARIEALRSRSVALALASISSRSRSVRCCGCKEEGPPRVEEEDLVRRRVLRGAAVER